MKLVVPLGLAMKGHLLTCTSHAADRKNGLPTSRPAERRGGRCGQHICGIHCFCSKSSQCRAVSSKLRAVRILVRGGGNGPWKTTTVSSFRAAVVGVTLSATFSTPGTLAIWCGVVGRQVACEKGQKSDSPETQLADRSAVGPAALNRARHCRLA